MQLSPQPPYDEKSIIVTGTITPTSSLDEYPTHVETYNKGGYRTVQSISERDMIPNKRKKEGMLVYVIDAKVVYILKNNTWDFFASDVNTLNIKSLDKSVTVQDVNDMFIDTANLSFSTPANNQVILSAPSAFRDFKVDSSTILSSDISTINFSSTESIKMDILGQTIQPRLRNYHFESKNPSISHIIQHNLNTYELMVNVYKKNSTAWEYFIPKYYMTNKNTIQVELTNATNIMCNIIALNIS